GITVSFVPENFTGDDFAEEFMLKVKPEARVLIPKGNLARNVIASQLSSAGVACREWIVYETVLPQKSIVQLKEIIENERV
ncbi:uroporphyrinogen-III synthase, partial [Pseudoalteromonas sp. SIMBA_148]